jgi:DNA-binding response OmpR family regulator
MVSKKKKILVVDDDINIARMIQRVLELEGHDVTIAPDGPSAMQIFEKSSLSLVLLDIIMPGLDGFSVCKMIRRISDTPIIMVTAKGNVNEKLEGFEAGADDYITKPFPTKELVARVSAVLRRSVFPESKAPPHLLTFRNLGIDYERQVATINGNIIDLTATEYRILVFLTNNPYKILSTEVILTEVWGEEYVNDIHLLQVNIGRLRNKIKALDKNSRYIETKSGQGYIFNPSEEPRTSITGNDAG